MPSRQPQTSKGAGAKPRQKHGFFVGPANLPEGMHKKKVKQIKQRLIDNAQIKKSYAKLKEREQREENGNHPGETGDQDPSTAEIHPERQAMLDEPETENPSKDAAAERPGRSRQRRPKGDTFSKDIAIGRQKNEEYERRQAVKEEAFRQREVKTAERERFRKAMVKARSGGRDRNERRLGRESKALLERVQRMVQD